MKVGKLCFVLAVIFIFFPIKEATIYEKNGKIELHKNRGKCIDKVLVKVVLKVINDVQFEFPMFQMINYQFNLTHNIIVG